MAETSTPQWSPFRERARDRSSPSSTRRLAERYQILELLGAGGMGEVYRARDERTGRDVALKTIREDIAEDEKTQARFQRELRAAQAIDHPSIVRCYEYGDDGPTRFFTMELIDGETIESMLRSGRRFSVDEVIAFGSQVLEGLEAAARCGVVHRDLKPHNLMLDRSGRARILDFGIAYQPELPTERLTGTSEILGTPEYVSPEQVRGEEPTHQSDLYSLGVVLYEMLTGSPPFHESRRLATLVSRLEREPDPPSRSNSLVPAYLDVIVLGCLARDPRSRYPSAERALTDLRNRRASWRAGPTVETRRFRYRHSVLAGLLAALMLTSSASSLAPEKTELILTRLRNSNGDPGLDWIGHVVPQMLVSQLGNGYRINPVYSPSPQSAQSVRTVSGAARSDSPQRVLHGSYTGIDGRLRFDLRILDVATGVTQVLRVDTPTTDALPTIRALGSGILQRFPGVPKPFVISLPTESSRASQAFYEARTLVRHGSFLLAERVLEEAVNADPGYAAAYVALAEMQHRRGDTVAARRTLEIADASTERGSLSSEEVLQLQAVTSLIDGDPAVAHELYREALERIPGDDSLRLRVAWAQEASGEMENALASYRDIIARAPDDAAAMVGMARSHLLLGRFEEAVQVAGKIVSAREAVHPETAAQAQRILGRAYRRLARISEARQSLLAAAALSEDVQDQRSVGEAQSALAELALWSNDVAEARARADAFLAISNARNDPRAVSDALTLVGRCELAAERLPEARERFLESLEIEWELGEDARLPTRLNGMAEILHALGDLTLARVYLELAADLLTEHPDEGARADNLFLTGLVQRDYAEYELAEKSLSDAIAAFEHLNDDRALGRAYTRRGALLAEKGRLVDAFRDFDVAVGRLSSPLLAELLAELQLARASWMVQGARVEKAAALLESIAPRSSTRASLHSIELALRARVALLQGRPHEARRFSLRAVQVSSKSGLRGDDLISRLAHAVVAIETDSPDANQVAEGAFEIATRQGRRPEIAHARILLARVLLREDRPDRAWREADRALQEADRAAVTLGEPLIGPMALRAVSAKVIAANTIDEPVQAQDARLQEKRACEALTVQLSAVVRRPVAWPDCPVAEAVRGTEQRVPPREERHAKP